METLSFQREVLAEPRCVVRVLGYVDSNTAAQLSDQLRDCADAGLHDVFVDLAQVDYVSSAGWGALISAIRALREVGGDVTLVAMQPAVEEVYKLLEFSSILDAYPNLDAALSART